MSCPVRARRLACAALIALLAAPAHAESLTIDLPTALERARQRAPRAVSALARVGEARARRVGARVLFTQNPEIQVGAGRRYGTPRTLAADAQLTQPLELMRRAPRIDVANAELERAHAVSESELRELSLEVTQAFYDARYSDLAVELAERNVRLATRGADVARRRRRAGDLTDLEVNLATIALGRARASLEAARAERAASVGRLGALIGAAPADVITLAGDLEPAALTLDTLRGAVAQRADVRAIEAEARVARAQETLADVSAWPDVGVWFGYEREEGDSIVLGGLVLTLPVWNRAQGERAAARARLRRAELERVAVVTSASRQVLDAFEAYLRARDGVDIFERDVLPTLADSESLLERSLDAGQITVNDYLVARQEILSARREHLERKLALARAAASARFVAGVTP